MTGSHISGWQQLAAFRRGQKFRQAHICYFRDKCVVFACNCKFANLNQYVVQYLPCYTVLLPQETLLLSQKSTFLPQVFQKVNHDKYWYCDKIANVGAQNFRPSPNFSAKALRAFGQLFPPCRNVMFVISCIPWFEWQTLQILFMHVATISSKYFHICAACFDTNTNIRLGSDNRKAWAKSQITVHIDSFSYTGPIRLLWCFV